MSHLLSAWQARQGAMDLLWDMARRHPCSSRSPDAVGDHFAYRRAGPCTVWDALPLTRSRLRPLVASGESSPRGLPFPPCSLVFSRAGRRLDLDETLLAPLCNE